VIIDNVYTRKRGRLIIWWESARNRGLDEEGDKKLCCRLHYFAASPV